MSDQKTEKTEKTEPKTKKLKLERNKVMAIKSGAKAGMTCTARLCGLTQPFCNPPSVSG